MSLVGISAECELIYNSRLFLEGKIKQKSFQRILVNSNEW